MRFSCFNVLPSSAEAQVIWGGTVNRLLIMDRAGHYIFAQWFLVSSFFPRLISAVVDWMSTILPHMVWPTLVRI